MKKVLIVNNNLSVGGIQKSLVNLLKEYAKSKFEISLMLFNCDGEYLKEVPKSIKILKAPMRYITLGLTKNELKKYPFFFILKGIMMLVSRLFSQRFAIKLLGFGVKRIKGYDVAISYSPLFHNKSFTNGVAPFVLDKTVSPLKICFIHNNYLLSGTCTEANNRLYSLYDVLVCCSESVKKVFNDQIPSISKKTITLRNFYDHNIVNLASAGSNPFDDNFINVVMVARLSFEKNHLGVFKAIQSANRSDLRLYVIGSGPLESQLNDYINRENMQNKIFMCGETDNPYVAMKYADYLIVNSFHEAAPIVFDEAHILGLPILSTKTTSANEMLNPLIDHVYESEKQLNDLLVNLKKKHISSGNCATNNEHQKKIFERLIQYGND